MKENKEAEGIIKAYVEIKEEVVPSGETQRQAQTSRSKRKESHSSSGGTNSDSSAGSPWEALDGLVFGHKRHEEQRHISRATTINIRAIEEYFSSHTIEQLATNIEDLSA